MPRNVRQQIKSNNSCTDRGSRLLKFSHMALSTTGAERMAQYGGRAHHSSVRVTWVGAAPAGAAPGSTAATSASTSAYLRMPVSACLQTVKPEGRVGST